MDFVLATFNRGKAGELRALLAAPGRRLLDLSDVAGAQPPDETGATLLENARIKAESALRVSGCPAIADDTGLEVVALGGAPGVHSARFAGPQADDAENLALLLDRLKAVPAPGRAARFRTVCVARFPDGRELLGEGVLEGTIAAMPRGNGGFGYDPVFEVAGLGRTLAELAEAEKNAISHRARAVMALARLLP